MLHPASVVKNIVLVHGAFCRGRRRINASYRSYTALSDPDGNTSL
jgi:hypothetical protein